MSKMHKRAVVDDQEAVDIAGVLVSDCIPFSYDFTKTHVFSVIEYDAEALDKIIAERQA